MPAFSKTFECEDSVYKVMLEPTKWYTAKISCPSFGSTYRLVKIENEKEFDCVNENLKKLGPDVTDTTGYWTGLHDFSDENTFRWEDFSLLDHFGGAGGTPHKGRKPWSLDQPDAAVAHKLVPYITVDVSNCSQYK